MSSRLFSGDAGDREDAASVRIPFAGASAQAPTPHYWDPDDTDDPPDHWSRRPTRSEATIRQHRALVGLVLLLAGLLIGQTIWYHAPFTRPGPVAPIVDVADLAQAPPAVNPYGHLPPLAIFCRSFSGAFQELLLLDVTWQLFWPPAYTQSSMVYVLDDESADDWRMGGLLSHMHPERTTHVHYEAMPGKHILSPRWRHLGYSRQQWSNFYCDQYVTEPFVGIVDSDATFTRTPLPGDLFDQQNRPVMYWYNARSPWCAAADYLIGQPCIGEFMINFPVVVNTTHFALMRAHIAAHLQVPFDEAWARMLNRYAEYSQFDVMATYLHRSMCVESSFHAHGCAHLFPTAESRLEAEAAVFHELYTDMQTGELPWVSPLMPDVTANGRAAMRNTSALLNSRRWLNTTEQGVRLYRPSQLSQTQEKSDVFQPGAPEQLVFL